MKMQNNLILKMQNRRNKTKNQKKIIKIINCNPAKFKIIRQYNKLVLAKTV